MPQADAANSEARQVQDDAKLAQPASRLIEIVKVDVLESAVPQHESTLAKLVSLEVRVPPCRFGLCNGGIPGGTKIWCA